MASAPCEVARHAVAGLCSGGQRQDPRARHLGQPGLRDEPKSCGTISSARDGTSGRSRFRSLGRERRAFLSITGISRYAKVWVNDQFLGEHIGYLSVQEYDVTKQALPGQTATIAIQVDSKQRWEVDAMYGASSLADYMDVPGAESGATFRWRQI